jgi:queuosine precursor transporter
VSSNATPNVESRSGTNYSTWFLLVAAVFITCLIVANIIAAKVISVGGLILPAAIVIFPISYIFGDVLTEVYGYRKARLVIWLGFFCNLIAVLAIVIGQALPSAVFWDGQAAYERILGTTPRLLIASFVAYLVGEFANSFVLAKMKIATKGKWLWARTITSTLIGEGLDSLVFIPLAGIVTPDFLATAIVTQWLVKCAYEVIATPFTYGVVTFLKRKEGIDVYDTNTNFNPLMIAE